MVVSSRNVSLEESGKAPVLLSQTRTSFLTNKYPRICLLASRKLFRARHCSSDFPSSEPFPGQLYEPRPEEFGQCCLPGRDLWNRTRIEFCSHEFLEFQMGEESFWPAKGQRLRRRGWVSKSSRLSWSQKAQLQVLQPSARVFACTRVLESCSRSAVGLCRAVGPGAKPAFQVGF